MQNTIHNKQKASLINKYLFPVIEYLFHVKSLKYVIKWSKWLKTTDVKT